MISCLNCVSAKVVDDDDKLPKLCLQRSWMMMMKSCLNCVSAKVMDDYLEFRSKYGPVDCLDTRTFFLGPKIAAETEVSITN